MDPFTPMATKVETLFTEVLGFKKASVEKVVRAGKKVKTSTKVPHALPHAAAGVQLPGRGGRRCFQRADRTAFRGDEAARDGGGLPRGCVG